MEFHATRVQECLAGNLLHLILMPTEACNFRCVYCYEDFRYTRMEPWVVRGVKRLLARRIPRLDFLSLSWFGGEPLLARDLMEEILLHVRRLARRHSRVRVETDVSTNAYLLSRTVFERLLSLGISRYQVSFDGPQEVHDRRRVLANGGGTYERIWNNLRAVRQVSGQFTILVRLHVDRENVAAVPRFLDQYRDELGDDLRFRLNLRKLSRLGGPNDERLDVLEGKEAQRTLGLLSQCAEERRVTLGNPPDAVCYAARRNSFLVRANGRINKCTVALEHPANQVGQLGEDGQLELDSPKMLGWMRGLLSGRPEELECPMRGLADPMGSAPAAVRVTSRAGARVR